MDEVIVPNYELLTAQTGDLAAEIATFTDNPTEANLEAAREVWIESRIPWEESEAFAFGPAAFLGLDAELDDWPLNEADVIAILESGDPLSPAYVDGLLTSQKGFHAIGYLLFGLDNDKTLRRPLSPLRPMSILVWDRCLTAAPA